MHLLLAILALTAARADEPQPAGGTKDVECHVIVDTFGTYFDPKGVLNNMNPAGRFGWIAKGLLFGAKGLNSAENWLEGRGMKTAHWSVSLKALKGTLPNGEPKPKNFMTSDDQGQAGYSAYKIAEAYAKKAGCTKSTIEQKISVPGYNTAWRALLRRLLAAVTSAFEKTADAAPDPLAPVSLKDAGDSFAKSVSAMSDALTALAASGCVQSAPANALVKAAGEQAKKVNAYVTKHLGHLVTTVAKPMAMEGAGACQGAFTSMVREIETRRSELAQTKQYLGPAASQQAEVVGALASLREYDVQNTACARQAFAGFKKSVVEGLTAIGSLGQVSSYLELEDRELTALNEKHKRLLASCDRGQGGARPAVSGGQPAAAGSARIAPVPAGNSRNGASDITGVKKDESKRP